jgi:hypothetical protein
MAGQIGSLLPFLNKLEPMMPGTKIKGAFLTLFNGSIITDSLEVISGVFGINGVRDLGFKHLLSERIYQYFSVFRHLSILIIPASSGTQS